jgi:F0F1-type ATP synthase assembly protein I
LTLHCNKSYNRLVSLSGPRPIVTLLIRQARPFRIVLRWQLIAVAILALLAWPLWGMDGVLSAALGGAINIAAGWVYGWRVARVAPGSAGDTLRTLFRAWALKIAAIVGLMWFVLTQYRSIVHAAFFAAFVVTVIVFSAAIAVRDTQ